MTLYEINEKILNLVDEETGEVLDFEQFQALQMEKEDKIHNIALWIKNLRAEETAIKDEIDNLTKRKQAISNKCKRLLDYLNIACEGTSRKFSNATVNFRNVKKVDVADEFIGWALKNQKNDLLRFSEPKADKKKLKELIENGQEFEFASIVNSKSISVR